MGKFKEFVIDQCLAWLSLDEDVALVTLVSTLGSSPRKIGSQIAVSGLGDAVGSISGGCAESAIVELALEAIGKQENKLIRFGEDSPYLDIKLPCGSSIDVFIEVGLKRADFDYILDQLALRSPAYMAFDFQGKTSKVVQSIVEADYLHTYDPFTQIVIAGNGPIVPALVNLCQMLEFDLIVCSSEPETLEQIETVSDKRNLVKTGPLGGVKYDKYSGLCSVFHDHEWELELLQQALRSEAFYVGALGSQRTHELRKLKLAELGLDATAIDRIQAPIGIDLAANGPHQIALAIAAELVDRRNRI
jgi:xanthine dehydrogenase accessory factor